MKLSHTVFLFFAVLAVLLMAIVLYLRINGKGTSLVKTSGVLLKLPEPVYSGEISVEEALLARRSLRQYEDRPLTLAEVSQLLWAAQGITQPPRGRTAPSAGALYPLEVYLVVGNVEDLQPGVYHYLPEEHALQLKLEGVVLVQLARAALGQEWVRDAPAVLVFSAFYERTTGKYGDRGIRYVHMEVGHAAQNVYLQAVSLELGTVFVGAFQDEEVKRLLQLQPDEEPMGLMPVGGQ